MNNKLKGLVHQHLDDSHIGKQFARLLFNLFDINIRFIHAHRVTHRIEISERRDTQSEQDCQTEGFDLIFSL